MYLSGRLCDTNYYEIYLCSGDSLHTRAQSSRVNHAAVAVVVAPGHLLLDIMLHAHTGRISCTQSPVHCQVDLDFVHVNKKRKKNVCLVDGVLRTDWYRLVCK